MYTPLPTPTSIRLLRYDGRVHDLPSFSLHTYEIDEAPAYYALSYTWGNPHAEQRPEYEGSRKIYCDGDLVDVGLNLSEALDRLPQLPIFDINSTHREFSKTQLVMAAEAGSLNKVEALLRAGADVSITDIFGETALHYAAENGHLEVVKALTRPEYLWARVWLPGLKDDDGRTPLDCALEERYDDQEYEEIISHLNDLSRSFDSLRFWWVDALCIDQENLEERSTQVQLMSSIFSGAQHVAVWLGESDRTTELAFRTIRELAEASDNGSLSYSTFDNLTAITSFFGRRWFSRTWVIQEALLARELSFYCGSECLNEDDFTNFKFRKGAFAVMGDGPGMHRYRESLATITQGLQLGQLCSQVASGSSLQMRMYDLVFYVSRTQCHEPRDRIFALLSLLESEDDEDSPMIKVDYNMPIGHIYTQATRHLLFETQDLSPLTWTASWSNSVNTLSSAGHPSWVPDYHAFTSVRGPQDTLEFRAKYIAKNLNQLEPLDPVSALLGWHWFNSCGSLGSDLNACAYALDSPPSVTFCPELQVTGLCVDRVKRIARPSDNSKIRFQADWLSLTADLPVTTPMGMSLAMVLACTVFGGLFKRDVPRPEGKPAQLAFYEDVTKMSWEPARYVWRDLICQSVVDSKHPNPASRELLDESAIAELNRLKKRDGYNGCMVSSTDIDFSDVKAEEAEAKFRGQLGQGFSLTFREILEKSLSHRTIYTTEAGYLGLGPAGMQVGDEIWLLPGSTVPMLLRPRTEAVDKEVKVEGIVEGLVEGMVEVVLEPKKEDDRYSHIGETYVHEMMMGEAVPENAESQLRKIVLI